MWSRKCKIPLGLSKFFTWVSPLSWCSDPRVFFGCSQRRGWKVLYDLSRSRTYIICLRWEALPSVTGCPADDVSERSLALAPNEFFANHHTAVQPQSRVTFSAGQNSYKCSHSLHVFWVALDDNQCRKQQQHCPPSSLRPVAMPPPLP